jgi:hypothetical protein
MLLVLSIILFYKTEKPLRKLSKDIVFSIYYSIDIAYLVPLGITSISIGVAIYINI